MELVSVWARCRLAIQKAPDSNKGRARRICGQGTSWASIVPIYDDYFDYRVVLSWEAWWAFDW